VPAAVVRREGDHGGSEQLSRGWWIATLRQSMTACFFGLLGSWVGYAMSAPQKKQSQTPGWLLALVIVFSPAILLLVVVALVFFVLTSICLHILIWAFWCLRGRDILFVYSDSPVWHDYIEQRLLPPIRNRAVVLNWSRRKLWTFSLARAAFYHFGGYREFNPLAVVFRPFRRTRKFRFWQPFRDWKHGRAGKLREMEKEFFALIQVPYDESQA
jgi:hypothetical protein